MKTSKDLNINNKNQSGAEILCIGSEILLGNIVNTNSQWIAEQLAILGIPHFRQTVIGDNPRRLKEAIYEASNRYLLDASYIASFNLLGLSPITVCLKCGIPKIANCSAIHWELVLTIFPRSISLPIHKISAPDWFLLLILRSLDVFTI